MSAATSAGTAPPSLTSPNSRFLSVKQVAEYLDVHEKKIYALAADGVIPATKITGKWLFPRDLIDQWLMESSHGGVLADRLLIAGSDDPLLYRAIMQLVNEVQGHALIGYTPTGTQLGLSLLARRRADVCAMHWGPASESGQRHLAVIRQYPQQRDWIVERAFYRQQGLILAPGVRPDGDLAPLFSPGVRWAMRQEGAGSQRFLRETLARQGVDASALRVTGRAHSEREAAALIAMDQADVAPGACSAAAEFGLEFLPIGWEAYDLVLRRGVYFRTLFTKLRELLHGNECQRWAQLLGGYDFSDNGKLIGNA